ncbi:hypothetical protein [Bordetella sp. 15P40C-2]|uniref:hypothetical protein n=1 Tax=Bordetella sp. 15P40C-2 TaxID=2572246 RepID=UPI001329D846|nr:hypothetical protein [Bordetella sp. 15P40C-2]MVW71236.1 hypothetical protein [Bordetella sp. 15P40C-2]
MKTLIKYRMLHGGEGEALMPGAVTNLSDAKNQLAHKKSLPTPQEGSAHDIDAILKEGGIDPNSLELVQLSE